MAENEAEAEAEVEAEVCDTKGVVPEEEWKTEEEEGAEKVEAEVEVPLSVLRVVKEVLPPLPPPLLPNQLLTTPFVSAIEKGDLFGPRSFFACVYAGDKEFANL